MRSTDAHCGDCSVFTLMSHTPGPDTASEHETQSHLINSRTKDIALVPAGRDERAEVGRRGVIPWINVRVVGAGDDVEGFGAKLRLEALPDAEVLEQRKIGRVLARSAQGVAAYRAQGPERWSLEYRRIELLGYGLREAARVRVADDVHPFVVAVVARLRTVGAITGNGERKSVGECNDRIRLPAAQDCVDQISGVEPLLSLAEGQFVKQAGDEASSLVIGGHAAIQIPA